MNITITGRKVNLKDNFKELTEKKLHKFERIFSPDADARVVVTLERNQQVVEITVREGGMVYRVEDAQVEMNDALDNAVSALGRQIRKNKTRLAKKIRASALDEYIGSEQAELPVTEETEYKIVRVKHFPVKPIDVEEAILQMNMVGHQFYMFRNTENGEINVVYRRKDGTYGLLEPEADE